MGAMKEHNDLHKMQIDINKEISKAIQSLEKDLLKLIKQQAEATLQIVEYLSINVSPSLEEE